MSHPATRQSLLLRLHDHADVEAWDEFVAMYRPVILRVAAAKGMQAADADDLAQQVLISVSGAIDRFDPENPAAKFRTWLRRIAENAILNALRKQSSQRAIGDAQWHDLLELQPKSDTADSRLLQTEVRRELFQLAAAEVRREVSPDVWSSFWQTSIEQKAVGEVADELGKSVGSVYAARSRVMKRLRDHVQRLQESGE
ncbi:MAG: sigma-70 family RNA polymerase sigma factor [Planctomycetota bacterium]